ncbi:MAG: hypothetical protein EU529_07865 [Promethearchaeota archaeon]|nr:MAG: hypothetical protein EU529_07865 [Candidatus Lokiarchaeota archaeon]
MKLNRLKSIAYNAIRTSTGDEKGYMLDPFEHYTPEFEIEIDLLTGKLTPDMEGDDVERYYMSIHKWFHEVLPKEGIPLDSIEKAVIQLSPKEKKCIIHAQGREFKASVSFKKS